MSRRDVVQSFWVDFSLLLFQKLNLHLLDQSVILMMHSLPHFFFLHLFKPIRNNLLQLFREMHINHWIKNLIFLTDVLFQQVATLSQRAERIIKDR